jgi:hypothetical protein
MFKIAAVLGLVAGGAGFAVYEYTDWFGGCSGHKVCAVQPEPVAVKPPCCQEKTESGEVVTSCCEAPAKVVVRASCCAGCCEAAPSATAKLAVSLGNPHIAGALLACEACATPRDASGATAAVVGGMAVVGTKAVK